MNRTAEKFSKKTRSDDERLEKIKTYDSSTSYQRQIS